MHVGVNQLDPGYPNRVLPRAFRKRTLCTCICQEVTFLKGDLFLNRSMWSGTVKLESTVLIQPSKKAGTDAKFLNLNKSSIFSTVTLF